MLRRHLSKQQWVALVVLVIGVSLIQPTGTKSSHVHQRPIVGMIAVLSACCSSGFAGVYFEKLLKGSKTNLWIRNIQLASWSVLFGLGVCLWQDYEMIAEFGFFQGYNTLTVVIILLQAA